MTGNDMRYIYLLLSCCMCISAAFRSAVDNRLVCNICCVMSLSASVDRLENGMIQYLVNVDESGADEFDAVDVLSDTHLSAPGSLTVASIPISPLPSNTPPVPSSLVQPLTPTTPRALFSIPARAHLRKGRDAHGSVFLHTPLPLPRHSSGSGPVELQFSSPLAPAESCRKQRGWLVPPALRLPVQPFGFEDSFSPTVVIQGEAVEP